MQLSCSGFRDTTVEWKEGYGVHTCHVGDSNYLFERCTVLLLKPTGALPNASEVVKDLHFVYEVDGKEVVGETLSPTFTQKDHLRGEYWYNCDIPRPNAIKINRSDPESSATNIKLVFTSTFPLNAQWNVEASHQGNKEFTEPTQGWGSWLWKSIFG